MSDFRLAESEEFYELQPIPNPFAGGPKVDRDNRLSLIHWLCWNDPNGVYADEDCIMEGWGPTSLETARRLYREQTFDLYSCG